MASCMLLLEFTSNSKCEQLSICFSSLSERINLLKYESGAESIGGTELT